jgi:bifunctional non-homologous end joining protein LigD
VLRKAARRVQLNEQHGEVLFRNACKLGLEGIVSKRKGSPYRSGRSPDWL